MAHGELRRGGIEGRPTRKEDLQEKKEGF